MGRSSRKSGIPVAAALILILAAALLAGAAVYYLQTTHPGSALPFTKQQTVAKGLRQTVQERADGVLQALKAKDGAKLSGFVHPDKGLRFSPYSHVDTQKDQVITKAQVKSLYSSTSKRLWGNYDGSGEPIELSFADYAAKFVYDKDFLEAPEMVFNEAVQRGNTINNIKEAYPGAAIIEYYFPGFDKKYNGMDWRSLSLIFEKKDGIWYLTGIAHGQWTI